LPPAASGANFILTEKSRAKNWEEFAMLSRRRLLRGALGLAAFSAGSARAANAPGVTATEIKFGQSIPYSGPVSAYAVLGRTEAAYFKMINDLGGVNGRMLNFISVDDAYSPPKTVEQTRRLVEEEHVAFLFGNVGTPSNLAIRSYLNENKVPQLFPAVGASVFADPQHFPWTMPILPNYSNEGRIYARHILNTKPDAKIGILFQNDGFGKDYVAGFKDELGADHGGMIVKEVSYELSDPTVDSQISTLQAAGVDTLLLAALAKAASQAIRKIGELDWTPTRYLVGVSASIPGTLKPAGLDRSKGVISATIFKDPKDSTWESDAAEGLRCVRRQISHAGTA
jgi:branched-chain amino acid transport system substrate-binding protein